MGGTAGGAMGGAGFTAAGAAAANAAAMPAKRLDVDLITTKHCPASACIFQECLQRFIRPIHEGPGAHLTRIGGFIGPRNTKTRLEWWSNGQMEWWALWFKKIPGLGTDSESPTFLRVIPLIRGRIFVKMNDSHRLQGREDKGRFSLRALCSFASKNPAHLSTPCQPVPSFLFHHPCPRQNH